MIALLNIKIDSLDLDLISIIYSFSAKMYGLRRSKRKTEKDDKSL
jgi:predicted site-specific integrase-resolvase